MQPTSTAGAPPIEGADTMAEGTKSRRVWRSAIIGLFLVTAALLARWRFQAGRSAPVPVYRAAPVQRGDITQTVSASGPLSAVSTVTVGSQVSGNISKLHVDFNDTVKVGQVIAEIDPSTYEAALTQAEGDLLTARALLELRQLSADRSTQLFASHMVPQSDHDQALAELHQQEGVVKIKEAALKSARINLERTQIRSPIDGVVIDRTIDVGQTVQANFAAPTLFVLAQDLRLMQVTANVSEADIGAVVAGQAANFTVDAFPGQTFAGQVREVRNNSSIVNNVVTYSTIITVENPDLRLRPGMTANVLITTAHRAGVLRVPNAALRFRPEESEAPAAAGTSARTLYIIEGARAGARVAGALHPAPVKTGLSDAAYTEILTGIDEGAVVATGFALTVDAKESTTNPFAPRMPASRSSGR